jgi:uncharacterized protein YkwD
MTLTKQRRRQPTAQQRRMQGMHHKHSKHYMQPYWPYLPIFAILGIGILANIFVHHTDHSVLGYATNIQSNVLLADTNAARSTNHKAALELNPDLTAAAQAKASDMARRDYWSHVTPDGKQPWSFINTSHYQYEAAGENLAYGFGSSGQVVTAWMNSPEHRANILNGDFRDVGFATANVADYQGHGPETIIVAFYAEPANLNAVRSSSSSFEDLSSSQTVSRLQVISNATWIQLGLAAICGAAITLFFVRHAFAWHKVLVRSEEFWLHHPFFDVFLISLAVMAFLLSHIAGIIL